MPQPSSWPQRRSDMHARLRLLGRPDVCESFFGFTDRAKVANEIVSYPGSSAIQSMWPWQIYTR